ncbi:MAG: hypothetical protein J6W52_08570 [Bacteroidaceae bacterium]|nr:hypothetical protein [Bacteroidaceae bacterium]
MYDITKRTAPKMPTLGKGAECIKLIASQISPDMREAIVPMIFPALGAYVSGSEFQYADLTWKETCGQMAHLVADSGMGKGQLTVCIETIMRKFRQHDEDELQKLVAWQKLVKSRGANKEKPVRPDVAFWFPPSDVTNAAFIQNAMACEICGEHTQYYNMSEIEMANRMCGGHKQVSQTIRNIYDKQRAGALRATADGVTGNPILRANLSFSSTPFSARNFYKSELFVGTFGRIVFSYKARQERSGRIPRHGKYEEAFLEKLDEYIIRLEACKGRFVIPQLNKLADKLAADMATIADLADDDVLWDMGKRAIVSAWKNGCILYILNGQQWTRSIGDLVEWMVYHDLWSKMQVFGDLLKGGDISISEAVRSGPKNMLDDLRDTFNEAELEALRVSVDKPKEGTKRQLRVWISRGFVTYSNQTGLYSKTERYKTP